MISSAYIVVIVVVCIVGCVDYELRRQRRKGHEIHHVKTFRGMHSAF